MTDLEAIDTRRARRAYTGPLAVADLRKLEAEAAKASLAGGLRFTLLEDGAEAFGGITQSYGMFSGVHSLITISGHALGDDAREKAGYYGERLVLEATKLGLGTCWVGGTFNREKVAATLPAGQKLLIVITVGPVKEKPSLVERTVRGVTHRAGKDLQALYTAEGDPPNWFVEGVQAAAAAPSALNRKPVHFIWKSGAAVAEVPGGETYQYIDLGIAKLHFEIAAGGRFEPGNRAVFIKE